MNAQESFTMNYGCMKAFKNGIEGNLHKVNLQVEFSVGTNKDVIITDNQGESIFVRTANPFVSETDNGMRYQVIPVKNNGTEYLIQYLENHNLRLIRVRDDLMVEYGCAYDFDESVGTNNNLYSVITDRAYFHNSPNENTKRNAYLVYGEVVESLSEESGFVYVIFENEKGIISKGWINKSSLSKY